MESRGQSPRLITSSLDEANYAQELDSRSQRGDQRLCEWKPDPDSVLHSSKGCMTIHLTRSQTICCVGSYDFTVHRGAAEIYGASLFEGDPSMRIYAPSTHALPIIRCLSPDGVDMELSSTGLDASSPLNLESLSPLFRRIWDANDYNNDDLWPRPPKTFSIVRQVPNLLV